MPFRKLKRLFRRVLFIAVVYGAVTFYLSNKSDLKAVFDELREGDFSSVERTLDQFSEHKASVLNAIGRVESAAPVQRGNFGTYSPIFGKPDIYWPHYDIQTLDNGPWQVGYCNSNGSPLWASYRAIATSRHKSEERPETFEVDNRSALRISTDMYTGSGFDRGHLFPNYLASVCYGREVQLDSFLMTNISPQSPKLNRGIWKSLEEKVGFDYRHDYESVHVMTGPYYDLDQRARYIGNGRIRLPSGFWKVILVENRRGKLDSMAFAFPQSARNNQLSHYLVSIDYIEELTQIDLFPDLDDSIETTLEAGKASGVWK